MLLGLWPNHWDYWNLNHKVTFDGANRLIIVAPGVTDLDTTVDIYSDWKEWTEVRDNLKYLAALRTVGGDTITSGSFVGRNFFLINGWRVRTWEGSHNLTVDGNLYVDEGGSVFVPTIGQYQILINMERSNLTDLRIVEVSGSTLSGGFSDSDRSLLQGIQSIVNSLPDSGSLTTIATNLESVFDATFVTSGSVASGSTDTVETNISAIEGAYNNHFAVFTSGSMRVTRHIDTFNSTNGRIILDAPLPFTPPIGSFVVILPGYNPKTGRGG